MRRFILAIFFLALLPALISAHSIQDERFFGGKSQFRAQIGASVESLNKNGKFVTRLGFATRLKSGARRHQVVETTEIKKNPIIGFNQLIYTSTRIYSGVYEFSDRLLIRDSADTDPSLWISKQPDSWFGADKAQHFLVSFWLAGSTLSTLKATRNNEDQSTVSCFGVTFGLGIAKEIYDLRHPQTHQASWKDLTADLLGTACGILLARSI